MERAVFLLLTTLCFTALFTTPAYTSALWTVNPEQSATRTVVRTSLWTSMSTPPLVFKGPFTVPSTSGTDLPCEFWQTNFTTTTGQYASLSGNFTADNPVNFFVVQQSKYQEWLNAGTCGAAEDAIASQLITTSYTFNAAIPSPGTWVIVFVNMSNAKNADGFLVAYLTTVGYTETELMTSTITSITTITTAHPASKVNIQFAELIAITGLIVGVIAGLVAIIMSRKRTVKFQKQSDSGDPA